MKVSRKSIAGRLNPARRRFRALLLPAVLLWCGSVLHAAPSALEDEFQSQIRPMVQKFCLECHSTEKQKGELDLERFRTFHDVIEAPAVWEQVIDQLSLGEMPPEGKPQPKAAERARLLRWVQGALDEAALARAGDPGPVVLRRLNNAEYTFTVRDLTGVESLDPAKEFPADSAAGEGFMNTGNSLVISPSMITKYLDAAKEIASHAVLLPDGFRFSSKTMRPDWTTEILDRIRDFYGRYTSDSGADKVNLQGIVFDTNEGGRLPIERYLRATLEERERLKTGGAAFATVAEERGLSPKYLESLWTLLNRTDPSLLLDPLRAGWRQGADAGHLAREIEQWQKALWKFASVGHIGKAGGPKAWMEPVDPLGTSQPVRIKLDPPAGSDTVALYFVATDAGDGPEHDYVRWRRPRLVFPGGAELLLRDARGFIARASARRDRLFGSTAKILNAIAEAGTEEVDAAQLAARHGLSEEDLSPWLRFLGFDSAGPAALDYLTNRIESSAGYEFVKGWGSDATPLLVANASDQAVRIPGNLKPHGVAVHPSPRLNIAVGWRSPASGNVRVRAEVTHAHPECGNGIEWFLDLQRGKTRQRLASGFAQGNRRGAAGPTENFPVRKDDLISLVIGPRDGNHACDLTDIEFIIESADQSRKWNLTHEISRDVLAGNPRADSFGNEAVWHFYTQPVSAATRPSTIPAGSLLAKWLALPPSPQKSQIARDLQDLLMKGVSGETATPDAALYRELASLGGPLFAGMRDSGELSGNEAANDWALDPALFGKTPDGSAADEADLIVRAPSVLEIKFPVELAAGAELVTEGTLAPGVGREGSVQLFVTTTKPETESGLIAAETQVSSKAGMWTSDNRQVSHRAAIIVNEGSAARARIERDLEEFRRWFPAALCYKKIVPVDEVVTLTLFHREDEHLCRLMLNEEEKAYLDRLWDELHYVSHDALKLVDVFEQIWQYATQDADPSVFEPMRKPIADGAAAFRRRLVETEPAHIDALVKFARRAYRRPLSSEEEEDLRSLYRNLRAKELPHEEAFRFTLARVLVAPGFLYRLEKAAPGGGTAPVSDHELGTRLSYFLWSSMPDEELFSLADSGRLQDPDVLAAQARRMLKDPRVRRLATEFGCAWLHVHDFGSLDEKSERHFPTFGELRNDMYEETIRFFTDLFQNDRSILAMLDADYTFLNENLARHYGIPGVEGPEWRRVDGVKEFSRGGILGFSSILAKQSGASRTSPILRGNWIYEALLGEKLPRPPAGVPELPEDETSDTLTMRQLVERHSSDPKCYGCHRLIDGYGLALEQFDGIGRAREKDLAGRPIDARTALFDGTVVDGFEGLRQYLLTRKRDAIVRQFCRKLLGYALGRGVLLSDQPLIKQMEAQLRENDYRFAVLVETIVRSRQFREIRGVEFASEK